LFIIREKYYFFKRRRKNMFNFFKKEITNTPDFFQSQLFDEKTFYQSFINDLSQCKKEVIIESPFITSARMEKLYPIFENLIRNNVKIFIFTRNPREHTSPYDEQSERTIQWFENIGIQVFLCVGNHHRKLAIVDREILWEGSLNILSQTKSREIMRKINNERLAKEMFNFLNYPQFIYTDTV
jgi:phosphatidylserine/phosphatidylglycerophosphate/cardiolipin synthase-like enzyme